MTVFDAGEIGAKGAEPVHSNQVHNPTQCFEVANGLDTTFNMVYLDNEHIAYFSTDHRIHGTRPGIGL